MKDINNLEIKIKEFQFEFIDEDGFKHSMIYQTNAHLVMKGVYDIMQSVFDKVKVMRKNKYEEK